ncbi:MAG: gamma-glutamylcyclotransferase family protein [Quisquiliibacterium sp.]
MANVFTYGSLMYPEVWDRVVRGSYSHAEALIDGFRRHALAGVSYPGVVEQVGASVRGRLYFDVAADDLGRLDAFESTEYRRAKVDARVLPGSRLAPVAPATESLSTVRAEIYLYLDHRNLLPVDWDEARFEREHLADFARLHQADLARSR